jgi:hypothetical protein
LSLKLEFEDLFTVDVASRDRFFLRVPLQSLYHGDDAGPEVTVGTFVGDEFLGFGEGFALTNDEVMQRELIKNLFVTLQGVSLCEMLGLSHRVFGFFFGSWRKTRRPMRLGNLIGRSFEGVLVELDIRHKIFFV